MAKKKKELNNKQAEESLEEQMSDISDAFRAEHETQDSFIWVAQTFEDHVIIEESGAMFKVGFVEKEGDFIFDGRSEWVEVERKVEFIEKSARAFIKQTGINALKSLSKTEENLTVGNYIVLFGDEDKKDLDEEWFTEKTQLESAYTQTGFFHVDWEHGHGKVMDGAGPSRDDILGSVDWSTMKVDDMGVWVERVLNRRNEYMALLEPLIEEKMIGTSSLAVGAGVKVKKSGEIEKWPLKRDTLTVIPAEPRMMSDNAIASLKSLVEAFPQLKANLPSGSGDDPDATAKPEEKPPDKTKSLEVINMKTLEEFLKSYAEKNDLKVEDLTDKQKYIALYDTEFAIEEPVDPEARMNSFEKTIQEQSEKINQILERMQNEPALEKGGYLTNVGGKSDPKSASFGDFLLAVARKDTVRLKSIYKSTWESNEEDDEKTDMSHLTGSLGGFVIPPEFENRLLELSIEMSPLTQMVTVLPVASNRGSLPVLDQSTAPTAGQGDVAWTATVTAGVGPENTALTATNPLFAQVNWNIHKVGGVTHAANELLEDAPMAIELILSALFATTINSKREFLILNGTGAGEAKGILQSAALIAVTTATNNIFALADALAMLSRFKPWLSPGIWVAHQGIIPDIGIIQVGSGQGVWLKDPKTDTVIGQPLLGKPIIYSEHLPQDDNSGDVILIDPKAYLLFQKRGMKIDFSEHVKFVEDQGTWRFTDRMDGQPWVSGAVTLADPNGSFTVSPYVKHHD